MALQDHRPLPWLAACAGALFFAACGMLLFESSREFFPRRDLPSFDARRAARLGADQRAVYEQELFSELSQWNRTSRRYATKEGATQRELRWRQLADEGFELAHVALQVLQPDGGFVYPLERPMSRLQAMAKSGDSGAMCLMTGLVSQVKRGRLSPEHSDIARQWLLQGAERGHAECQLQLGRRLILGIDGVARDARRGLELEFAARRAGYAHDVDGLVAYFQRRWSTDSTNLTRLYCWLSIDAGSRLTDGPQRMLKLLRADAHRLGLEQLQNLESQLASAAFSLQQCVGLGAD